MATTIASPHASLSDPVVQVNECVIRGRTQPKSASWPKSIDIFFNIPYARAQRFRPAVLCDPQAGEEVQAQVAGPTVPFALNPGEMSESPLTLNIARPSSCAFSSQLESSSQPSVDDSQFRVKGSQRKPLPVVVYIHGGAFNFSSPQDRDLGSFVAWGQQDVVAVGISYRLGALGFLAGAEEGDWGPDESEEARELNLGLRDQRVAVEWVRRWIGAFGGDGENITLMGVSAGAHSIGHHILNPSPLPFTKAILESGSPTARSILSPSHPRVISQLSSLKSHLSSTSLITKSAQPLKHTSIDDLLTASVSVWADNAAAVSWPFQPVVDGPGGVVPDLPVNLWQSYVKNVKAGAAKGMTVMTGFCSHEGTGFVPQFAKTNADFRQFFRTLIPSMTASDLDELEKVYPDPTTTPDTGLDAPPNRGAQFKRLYEAYGHYAYICPVLHTAHTLAAAGAKVYVYEYAAVSAPYRTASHAEHAELVAHDMALIQKPGLVATADEMVKRWTNFASLPAEAADGTRKGQWDTFEKSWPAFKVPSAASPSETTGDAEAESSLRQLLVFGAGNDEDAGGTERGVPVKTRRVTGRELEQCRFWWSRMELSQGMGRARSRKLADLLA